MKKIKVIAVILIVILIGQIYITSKAASSSSLQSEKATLNSQIKETEQALEEIKAEKSTALAEVENLIVEISELESQITELDEQIDSLNTRIEEAQASLDEAEAKYNEQEQMLNESLLEMYETGESSYLDFILSSDGLAEFLSNYYLVSELTQYYTDFMEEIQEQKTEIEEQKQILETSKSELDSMKSEKEQTQTEIETAKSEKEQYVSQLTTEEKETQEELETFEADKRAIEEELRKIAQQSSNTVTISTPSASGYIFPVAGLSKSNIRNLTYPSYAGHTGVDVNINVTGKSVVAVKAGTVEISTALKYSNGNYRSYGEYIVINHHDGTMTLYAHMLEGSRKVSKGDTVSQGQVIGTVGSTGNSTGTHLHFEVRVNGSPVNPIPYLP